jgi:hypothetical protein
MKPETELNLKFLAGGAGAVAAGVIVALISGHLMFWFSAEDKANERALDAVVVTLASFCLERAQQQPETVQAIAAADRPFQRRNIIQETDIADFTGHLPALMAQLDTRDRRSFERDLADACATQIHEAPPEIADVPEDGHAS